jgi:hypothetical protein
LRQTGFVTGSLDLGLSQAIGFFDSLLDLVLDSQCYFQRDRGDAAKQQLPNGVVECLSGDVLTIHTSAIEVLTRTEIIGPQLLATGGVPRVHTLPTDAAQKQALEQGRTFPRWALSIGPGRAGGILAQTGLVSVKLFPTHISGMGILDQDLPLIQRQTPDCSRFAIG